MKKSKNVDPKKDKPKGTSGSGAKLSRDSKGNLKATKAKDFGGVTNETIRQDRQARSKSGDRTFSGAPAPRSNKVKLIKSGPIKSATRKVIKQARKKPTGSPQARRSQKNNRF